MSRFLSSALGITFTVGISASASAADVIDQVTLDWVTVGNPGNAAQSASNRTQSLRTGGDGNGAVGYVYRMARNETTISDYAKFLNAVAATDTYGLYSANMATNANIAGISRSGTSGSYTYSVIGNGDRPITYVSWFDAARFANWLHHGQPTGLLGAGLIEDGAYTLLGAVSGSALARNAGAQVWIPTENEWFKAAYYDATHISGTGGYWLHANRSNSVTSNDFAVAGAANFRVGDYASTPGNNTTSTSQDYLTEVGAYGSDSQSYYGLNDMAGNVWEWTDLTGVAGSTRGQRGGAWDITNSVTLASSTLNLVSPSSGTSNVGFRLATVPEPGTTFLAMLFGAGIACRRKR